MRAAASVPREQRAPKFYAMSSIEDTPCTRCASLSIYTCGAYFNYQSLGFGFIYICGTRTVLRESNNPGSV